MKECQELSSHLDEFNSPVVFCHNDLVYKNIIYSEEKSILDLRNNNLSQMFAVKAQTYCMVGNFCGSNFCGLGNSANFVGLYFHGVPTIVT